MCDFREIKGSINTASDINLKKALSRIFITATLQFEFSKPFSNMQIILK